MIPVLDSKLAPLLTQPGVTDLLVNSFSEIYLARSARGLERVPSPFESELELAALAQSWAASAGKNLDQSHPFADLSADKFRIHAVLGSACSSDTRISIRVHAERQFALDELVVLGSISPEQASFLRAVVRRRESFLISGSTGSGKTTLLRAMLMEATTDRIVALEDNPELQIKSGHFVSLKTKPANVEEKGAIGLDRLLHEALRMRPDRLVVGEVRSVELLSLLSALNTGHEGAGATIHANSLASVPARLEAIAVLAKIPLQQLGKLVSSAFTWCIHVDNHQISELGRFDESELAVQIVWP